MCYRALGLMSPSPRFGQGQPCQGAWSEPNFHLPQQTHTTIQAYRLLGKGRGWRWDRVEGEVEVQLLYPLVCVDQISCRLLDGSKS